MVSTVDCDAFGRRLKSNQERGCELATLIG
jgi:hypothetical protein